MQITIFTKIINKFIRWGMKIILIERYLYDIIYIILLKMKTLEIIWKYHQNNFSLSFLKNLNIISK